MKFIHLSDLHLGKRVNEYSMLEDQEYILKKIINIVDAEKPDGVIIAGDVYDKSVPAAEAVQLFDNFLVQLAKRKLEVFVISGNHDSPERIAFGARIMDASGIHMSPVYDGNIAPISMRDGYGTVDVYMLPFIKPAHVRRFCDDEITTYTDAINHAISKLSIAHKSAKAPTEAQLKRAKENADKARKGAEDLSGKCKEAKGILDAKKAETEKLAKELWQSVTFEDVENDLPEEQKVVSAEIAALDTALSEEEKKVSRRSALSESLPKTEMSLAERDKDITARSTALEADRASLSEKKNQRNAAKESLRFDNIAEAQRKSEALGKTVSEMKEAYDNAQSALSDSDKKIAGYNASITELSKQLSSDCDLDKEAETKKKAELSEKRTADDDAAKALHTHIESNTKVLANIQAKVGDLDALEKRYTWLKALSNTANGNISGKEKVMLETYIQMTYFDRIIARANTRFMVMSGGQYELKRRKEAENNRSQSGLDLDVIDHYNGTERSVKTLSGGESFKASLSLALGLSDEIQASAGGVKLDTMFVDEGFGSLDDESIDQAMKALLSLVDGNRLVGIISHVADLKNRIDKQIVVTKEKSGGSKANIVT